MTIMSIFKVLVLHRHCVIVDPVTSDDDEAAGTWSFWANEKKHWAEGASGRLAPEQQSPQCRSYALIERHSFTNALTLLQVFLLPVQRARRSKQTRDYCCKCSSRGTGNTCIHTSQLVNVFSGLLFFFVYIAFLHIHKF